MANLASGEKTVAASAAQVGSSVAVSEVLVLALSTNSGTAYIGGSDVTTSNGFPLAAGAALSVATDDLGDVWVIGTAADKVRYLAALEN